MHDQSPTNEKPLARGNTAGPVSAPMLRDSFGRIVNNLRISVTDRCNFRCRYCMPAEGMEWMERSELLTFEEITRIVRIGAGLGISKIRLTGGEPLMRRDLHLLVQQISGIPGIRDLALTTNGLLLAEQAAALKEAGLHRLNVSLDTLSEATFERISRRTGLRKVLDGIFAAQRAGFEEIRLNAVAIRGLSED
ncbi:MAG: radical SAM protein, partial [Bacteroidota bacterium]